MKVKEVGEDDFAPWITGPLGNYAYAHVLFPCKMEDVECIQHTSGIIVENDNVDDVHLHTNDKIMYYKKRYKENGVIEIITEEGEIVNASYHFFNNSYNVFVFLFPKGEHKKSKVNLILQNIN